MVEESNANGLAINSPEQVSPAGQVTMDGNIRELTLPKASISISEY
jgi:hypothetical protein